MIAITSPAFQQDAQLPAKYTCDGQGTNPPLKITDVPPAAKSLALIAFDPDVPKSIKTDGRYLHWAVWNLQPATTTIEEGRGGGLSEGGRAGYIPACPPNGEHRYVFQVFALDTTFGDRKIDSEGALRQAMDTHVLEQAELVSRYTSQTSGQLNFVLAGIVLVAVGALVYRFTLGRRSS